MRGIKNQAGEIIKAGCVVVNDKQEVLLVADKSKSVWSFPKGHIEQDETVEQTALRETLEETGYKVTIQHKLEPDLTYINKKTQDPIRLTLFLASPDEKVGGGEEFSEWMPIDEAKKRIYPNLRPYLEKV